MLLFLELLGVSVLRRTRVVSQLQCSVSLLDFKVSLRSGKLLSVLCLWHNGNRLVSSFSSVAFPSILLSSILTLLKNFRLTPDYIVKSYCPSGSVFSSDVSERSKEDTREHNERIPTVLLHVVTRHIVVKSATGVEV